MRKKLTDYYERSEDGKILGMTVPVLKPAGWTSFDVVKKLRNVTGFRKVGHAGTLDPFAEGVLVVGFGTHTRSLDQVKDGLKEYRLILEFGKETDTCDISGEVTGECPTEAFAEEVLRKGLDRFVGNFEQIPPLYSARKVGGKALYRYARAGQDVERKAKAVRVESIRVLRYEHPELELLISCGPGTYMRSIAYDLGRVLGSMAYAKALYRTAVGGYTAEMSFDIMEFAEAWKSSVA